jgi:hypothetical protein
METGSIGKISMCMIATYFILQFMYIAVVLNLEIIRES